MLPLMVGKDQLLTFPYCRSRPTQVMIPLLLAKAGVVDAMNRDEEEEEEEDVAQLRSRKSNPVLVFAEARELQSLICCFPLPSKLTFDRTSCSSFEAEEVPFQTEATAILGSAVDEDKARKNRRIMIKTGTKRNSRGGGDNGGNTSGNTSKDTVNTTMVTTDLKLKKLNINFYAKTAAIISIPET
ncbi:hypothetical protein SADUNF_Sadunf16G0033700 [Salix dunnii]|uniref:Uncharacterized protein n=1 Tax=Salix dunnii TaxID=1413687 RepID=A0A835J9M1_9ROSI|nr:hypothetical protein SADUNF_Sadunf16G0033700 [Salix dunnii]